MTLLKPNETQLSSAKITTANTPNPTSEYRVLTDRTTETIAIHRVLSLTRLTQELRAKKMAETRDLGQKKRKSNYSRLSRILLGI